MNEISTDLIHDVARDYCLCLADFPANLTPEHLAVPAGEQAALLGGLSRLRTTIGTIYDYFYTIPATDQRWIDQEACYQAVEAPVKLLWALGASGQLIQGPELRARRADLDLAIKKCGCKDPVKALGVLKAFGFAPGYYGLDGAACPGGFKACTTVGLGCPTGDLHLLRALIYFATRLPQRKGTQKGIIIEIFLRADFRPLLPGYTFHIPHLPAELEEVTRTFTPETLEIWKELTAFMGRKYPQYRLYFRVPRVRGCGWVADYSNKENDYGLYSLFIDKRGVSARIVLIEGTIANMFNHLGELSEPFQEDYLNAVACKDCVRCGKHVYYTHGDHVHRLCKSPWYISPYLRREDLPDIERLIDFRLNNFN